MVRTRTIRFSPDRVPFMRKIRLGFEGDNLVERLQFMLPVISGHQTATLMKNGFADGITLALDEENGYYIDLTREIIGSDGEAEAYIRIDGSGGEVWQSAVMRLTTGALPDVETEIEQQYPTAVGQMLTAMAEHSGEMEAQEERVEQAAQRAEEAAERAENAGGGGGGSGEPGKDGGYYQPSVTDGVLSWTASEDDMPAVPDSDIRGPKGDAGLQGEPGKDGKDGAPGKDGQDGLPGKTAYQYAQDGGYTGTEAEFAQKLAEEIPEPYTLPVATADTLGGVKVGDGLVMDGETLGVEPEGEYVLVRSFSLTEGVNVIEYDTEASGAAMRYTATMIKITIPVGDTKFYLQNFFVFDNGSMCNAIQYFDMANIKMGSRVECYPEYGFYRVKGYAPSNAYGNTGTAEADSNEYANSRSASLRIVGIKMQGYRDAVIPAGTYVQIWGVRA